MKYIFIFVLSIFTFIGCKHEPVISDILTNSDSCYADTVYYVNDIQPLFTANCAYSGCHNAQSHESGVDLSSYDAVMQSDVVSVNSPTHSNLYEVLTSSGEKSMPPSGHLTQDQIDLFTKWMQQGARNNSCSGICDTTDVSFTQHILPIIENNCKSCHSGSNPSGYTLLTNYTEIHEHAIEGHLVQAITGNGLSQMPPGGAMNACNITMIKKWVDAGSLNN